MLMYQKGSEDGVNVDQHQVSVLEGAGWSKQKQKAVEVAKPAPVAAKVAPKATATTVTKK